MMVTATLGAATAGYVYIQYNLQKTKAEQLKAYETSVGQAMVGGPFTLQDCDGKAFPSSNLHGEFSVLYFGFTHCPDICPDELEKLAEALDKVGTASSLLLEYTAVLAASPRWCQWQHGTSAVSIW